MMKNKEDKLSKLLFFSLVPISQICIYFFSNKNKFVLENIHNIQKKLSIMNIQMTLLQLIIVIFYSIILFLVMFFINFFILKLSKTRNSEALFVSITLSIGMGNLSGLITNDFINNKIEMLIPALVEMIVLAFSYLTYSKDRKGAFLLFLVTIMLNVIPSVVVYINT